MALTVTAEIKSDDPAKWALIKDRIAYTESAYSLDDATYTARMKFTADWDGSGVAALQLEQPA